MEVGPTLVADPQALELVEPGEGPLYHPASAAEARAVDDTSAGDEGLDPALPQQAAVLVVVVAPVSEEPLGPVARASTTARIRGIAFRSGISCVTSCRFPPVRDTASGVPRRSTITWCLEPGRPRSTGDGPT